MQFIRANVGIARLAAVAVGQIQIAEMNVATNLTLQHRCWCAVLGKEEKMRVVRENEQLGRVQQDGI